MKSDTYIISTITKWIKTKIQLIKGIFGFHAYKYDMYFNSKEDICSICAVTREHLNFM